MTSLLELQQKKVEIQRQIKNITDGQMVYTPETKVLRNELEKVLSNIKNWGKEQAVYRIM